MSGATVGKRSSARGSVISKRIVASADRVACRARARGVLPTAAGLLVPVVVRRRREGDVRGAAGAAEPLYYLR